MGLKKGMTNNLQGRKPGTPNQSTTETKAILNAILKRNFSAAKVQRDLNALTPDRRLELLTKLLQFALPRPVENSLKLNTPDEDNPFSSMVVEVIDRREMVDKSLLN
jgi:hypothetical protein